MKTTERITRLNDDMWLYEIKTEDPVILTRPFTVRYPMRHDPKYEWWEYACHEGNTIVPNYVTTSRFERANPKPEAATADSGGGGHRQRAGRTLGRAAAHRHDRLRHRTGVHEERRTAPSSGSSSARRFRRKERSTSRSSASR